MSDLFNKCRDDPMWAEAEIESLTAEVSRYQAMYELVINTSHFCSGRDCIGYHRSTRSATEGQCYICSKMYEALSSAPNRRNPLGLNENGLTDAQMANAGIIDSA